MVRRARDWDIPPPPPPPPPPDNVGLPERRSTRPRRESQDGLTLILALAAGFALGRMGEFTHWWQWVIAFINIGAFLHRFLTRR